LQAANHKARADEQHEGEGDLSADQKIAQVPATKAGVHDAWDLFKRVAGVGVRKLPCRSETKTNSCKQGDADGEREHAQIETTSGSEQRSDVPGHEVFDKTITPETEQQASGAADGR